MARVLAVASFICTYSARAQVIEEGETVTLDCEGADPLSFRMDYDEEAASVLWEWEGLWGTDMSPLDATDLSSPLFTAPPGSAGEEYHYIASPTFLVPDEVGETTTYEYRLTVSAANAVDATAEVSVTMRVPGVYVPGEGASQLHATLLSISFAGPMSATFLVETPDYPFVGEVVAYDGDGRELGRRETLVYTRSRVRIPLDRMPEEGSVLLRFEPRGSNRVPEPVFIEWNAPRRDIGEAGNKDETPTSQVLVKNS